MESGGEGGEGEGGSGGYGKEKSSLLAALDSIEDRVVDILKGGAELVAARDDASLERGGREFVKKVLTVRRDLNELIGKMPRTDYPRQNNTLRERYLDALQQPPT